MKNDFGQFNDDAYAAFMEAATEYYDFQTCQRGDGSYYGTGGQCRKGTPAEKPENEKKKSESGGVDSVLTKEVMGGLDQMREFQNPDPVNEDIISDAQARIDGVKGGLDGLVKMEEQYGKLDDQSFKLSEKADEAENKAIIKLNKIVETDNKVDDMDLKIDNELGKDGNADYAKVEKLTQQKTKLEAQVDNGLSKEFPDYAKAKKEESEAYEKYSKKTENMDYDDSKKTREYKDWSKKFDTSADLKADKLSQSGYDELISKKTKSLRDQSAKLEAKADALQEKIQRTRNNIDGVAGEYYRNGRPSLAVQQGYGTKYGGGKGAYDKQVDKSVDQIYDNLKAMGITPPSKSVIESQVLMYNSGDIDKSQLYQEITQ